MTQPTAATTTPAPAEKTPLWEDFIDVLFSPTSVFRRRERGSWFKPLLIIWIAGLIIFFASLGVLQPLYDAQLDKAMDKLRENPQMTEQAIESARSISRIFTYFLIAIGLPMLVFVVGLVSWLIGKLFDAKQELQAALVVSTYAMVPRVVQGIVNAVQGLVMKPEQLNDFTKLSFSPARFVDPATTSPITVQLLNRFDLFTIWVTVLIGIGMYVTGKVSKAQAATIAIIVWIIGGLPAVLGALQQAR